MTEQAGIDIRILNSTTGELEETVTVPWGSQIQFTLQNEAGDPVECRGIFGINQLWLGVDGYGNLVDNDEDAIQVALDVWHHDMPPESYPPNYDHPSQGHAMVLIWPNVNIEDADIHRLPMMRTPVTLATLAKARVENREEE